MVNNDRLPPSSPEAERGVLGCCLLNTSKTALALKTGVSSRWFYDLRHIEIFNVLAGMARNGGGDSLVATLKLRELGKLDQIGGLPYHHRSGRGPGRPFRQGQRLGQGNHRPDQRQRRVRP